MQSIFHRTKLMLFGFLVVAITLASLPLHSQALSVSELDLTPPRAPMNFIATAGDAEIRLSWTSVDPEEVDHYRVYAKSEVEQLEPIDTEDTFLKITPLDNGKLYDFFVTALDREDNESKPSNIIALTPSKVETVTQKQYKVAAWMPTSQDVEDAREAFEKNLDVYDIISPFWFNAMEDGSLEPKAGARDKGLIQKAKDNGILVIPSITNNFSGEKAAEILHTPGSILNHIDIIVSEVTDNGYDGIDIDYENISPEEKNNFTFFMRNLADRLHQKGKVLTITSQPKLSDNYNWNGPGAIDWQVAGEVADYVRIMTYDYSRPDTVPGPIAPKAWLKAAMEYARDVIPPQKVLAGIPFYGYDWALTDFGLTSGLVWDGAVKTIKEHPGTITQWDEDAGEPWYEYEDEFGLRKAYFNNGRSIEEKLKVVRESGVGGITIWRLGSEDPAAFEVIRKQMGKEVELYSPAAVTAVPKNRSIKISWEPNTNDTVTGYNIYGGSSKDTLQKVGEVREGTTFTWSGLQNDKTYVMRVTAFNARGKESKMLNMIRTAPTRLVTAAPVTNLRAKNVTPSSIKLEWRYDDHPDFVGNIVDYDIRYSTETLDAAHWHTGKKISSKNIQVKNGIYSMTVQGLTPDTHYTFGLKSLDEFQQSSGISNIITLQTLDVSPPPTPKDLHVTLQDGEAILQWDEVHEYDLAGYELRYTGPDGDNHEVFVGNRVSLALDFLNPEKVYDVRLVSIDNAGNKSSMTPSYKVITSELEATTAP